MIRRHLLAVSLLVAFAAPAAAADRNFSVTGFERIRVDGPFRVRVTTGVAPFARATGSAATLDNVSVDVQGQTLVVRPNRSGWGGYPGDASGPVEIAVGTHELDTAWLNGAGSLEINRVEGLSFGLNIQGSGSASIAEASVDDLKIGVSGAGTAEIGGTASRLTAVVRGSSQLDAATLKVRDAVIGAEGPSLVRATVSGSAKIDATGTAHIEISGDPACTVRAAGSATVLGCRQSGELRR